MLILMLVWCRIQNTRWTCTAGHHAFTIRITWAFGDCAAMMAATMLAVLASTSRAFATCIARFVMAVTAAMMMFFAGGMTPIFRCVPFHLLASLLFVMTPTSRSVTSSVTFSISLPMPLPPLPTLNFIHPIFPPPLSPSPPCSVYISSTPPRNLPESISQS
jgi:hypothetical protein